MNKILKTAFLVFAICIVSAGRPAFAQWDLRGCSQHGVTAADPKTLESSLWTFRSDVWDGYIDFQEEGKYWTHWGFGTWAVTADGKGVHLANDYNDKTYEIAFVDNGYRFQGIRSDGLIISGLLICNKYAGGGPQIPKEDAEKVAGLFTGLLGRDGDPKELKLIYRRISKGIPIETIQEELMQTEEYKIRAAKRAEEIAEAERNGTLNW
jgi:hypothetical protein